MQRKGNIRVAFYYLFCMYSKNKLQLFLHKLCNLLHFMIITLWSRVLHSIILPSSNFSSFYTRFLL